MTDRKEGTGNRIPWHIIVIALLSLGALCVYSILFGWRNFGPMIGNAVTPAAQSPTLQVPTATLMPTSISIQTYTPLPSTETPTKILSISPTTLSLKSTTTPTPPGLKVITIAGTTNKKHVFTVPNYTLFDATNWMSIAIGPFPLGTTGRAVEIYGTPSNASGRSNITWRGGVIVGSIPKSWNWRKTHEFGGGGIFIHNDGSIEWQFIRIHNIEDGVKPREALAYSNTGSWILRNCYFTAIRDDAIENDRFEPGTVQDCLFDGVYTFISEQDETVGSNTPIGPNEDNTIYINRVYARLYGTNDAEGPGKWFKLPGDVPHHKLAVSDSVFAVGSVPRLGWSDETIPPEVSWMGNNNFILWLGSPGTYGGSKPEGVTFLEGTAAQEKWISVRNKWLTDHGLPSQNFSADFNPHEAPVMQIPVDP